jgi:hypothetical protein
MVTYTAVQQDVAKRETIDRMLRIDHCGEHAAVRIYQGQLDALKGTFCLLSAVSPLLSAVSCLLSAVFCLPSAVSCLLSAVSCLSSAVCFFSTPLQ